jgi:peptide deformylase
MRRKPSGRRRIVDLDLKLIGDECLRKPSVNVEDITEDVITLAEAMKQKMVECNGIGLAAPQVGKNIRLIVVKLMCGRTIEMINPRISWTSDERCTLGEGCLSIPGETQLIDRSKCIRVRFQDITGQHKYWKLSKMDARVVLHEYDHLEGLLMVDYQKTD